MQVENTKTLLLPDRGSNNRLDGLTNLLHNPAVGLLFLIPDWSECFRLNYQAQISVDPALCARFAQNGVPAKSVLVIRVDEAFIHCGRAIDFAGLWESNKRLDAAQLPKALDIFKAHVALHKAAQ